MRLGRRSAGRRELELQRVLGLGTEPIRPGHRRQDLSRTRRQKGKTRRDAGIAAGGAVDGPPQRPDRLPCHLPAGDGRIVCRAAG